jgi:hypothetical protein
MMHQAQFPRDAYSNIILGAVAQSVSAAAVKVAWISATNTSASRTIIFRRPGGGAEYFRIKLPSFWVGTISNGFDFVDGLEVLTAAAAGDVNLVLSIVEL